MKHYPFRSEICNLYEKGNSLKSIQNALNLGYYEVRETILKYGKIRGRNKHDLDHFFFNKIDNHGKSYLLGLLWADGSICTNKHGEYCSTIISLIEEDSYLIDSFKREIGYTGKISFIDGRNVRKNQRKLAIYSKQMAKDLSSYGMKERKTYDGGTPSFEGKYIPSFLLGYFDGDGCFSAFERIGGSRENKTNRKCCYSMSCHEDMAIFLKNTLLDYKISCSLVRLKNKNVTILTINGNENCAKFYNLIYKYKNEIPVFLERKMLKAKYFLDKYGASIKLKYNLPKTTRLKDIPLTAKKLLTNQKLLDFQAEWAEIQSRENIVPSATSSQRFLPNAQNKPV